MAAKIPHGARVSYARQFRRCGKAECRRCAGGSPGHGPYWYAFWDQDGRRRSCYVGKELPAPVGPAGVDPALPDTAASSSNLRVRTLGAFEVWRGTIAIPASVWKGRTATALFMCLLSAEGHRLLRDQVLEWLWPEIAPVRSRQRLYTAIHELRRILDLPDADQSFVVLTRDVVALRPSLQDAPTPDWLDAVDFARAAQAALRGRALSACSAAIALYTGAYLPYALYDDWAAARRNELGDLYIAVLLHQADLHASIGESEQALRLLRAVLAADPCHESATSSLMEIAAAGGARAEAIQAYHALQTNLRESLGLSPTQALHTQYTRILAHPTNLPSPLTSFIGRRKEVADLVTALSGTRVLSLVGTGGSGKTRLALEVASSVLYEYQDGVWLVNLSAMSDARALLHTVARVLDLPERSKQSPYSVLLEHVRDKHMILVLDNCEHLAAPCAALVGEVLAAGSEMRVLATSRTRLSVAGETVWPVSPLSLPTFLPMRPEVHDLPPTGRLKGAPIKDQDPVVTPEYIASFEAVQLFMARAQAARPGFSADGERIYAVGRICGRLDGLPLAIELAAATIGTISLEVLESRLDDRFTLLKRGPRTARNRQQTLRATIDWSYQLLDDREQQLLRVLSVFPGGFSAVAATAMEEAYGHRSTIITTNQVLEQLAAKSLVQIEPTSDSPRYRQLETVRQYGVRLLKERGETVSARAQFCRWYVEQIEGLHSAWNGPGEAEALAWLDTEHENLSSALEWAWLDMEHENMSSPLEWTVDGGGGTDGVRLLAGLWRFWEVRGYLSEGRWWQDRILVHAAPIGANPRRARALLGAGRLAELQGDFAKASAWYSESLASWRILGDLRGIADTLLGLGVVQASQGLLDAAELLFTESLTLNRRLMHLPGMIVALNNLGGVAYYRGEGVKARTLWEESLDLSRRQGDVMGAARALNNLGDAARGEGDFRRALDLYREGLTLGRPGGNLNVILLSLEGLSVALSILGRCRLAARLWGAVAAGREAQGISVMSLDREAYERDTRRMITELGAEPFAACVGEGRVMGLDAALDQALADHQL